MTSKEHIKFEFEPPFTYIVVGNSGSGKTTLINHLLQTTFIPKFKKNIFIMSPTMKYSGDFQNFKETIEGKNHKNGEHYFYEWDTNVIKEIIEEQKYIIERHGKDRLPHILIIIDDFMDKLHTSPAIDELFFRGRHFNISTILLFQKLKGLSRVGRIQVKYLTFFRTANESELEDIWDEYFSRTQKKKLEPIIHTCFEKPWSFIHLNLKTQNFHHRISCGADKKLIEYISPNNDLKK